MNNNLRPPNNFNSKEDFIQKWVNDILQKYEKKVGFITPPICEKTLCKVIEDLKGIKITIEQDKKVSTFDEGFLMPIQGGFIIKYSTLDKGQEKFPDVRIRATICHELSHILFYDCTSLIPKLPTISPEDWCHDIARYLLLPAKVIKEKFLKLSNTSSNLIYIIERLSKEFQVSRMLIVKRITEDLSLLKDTMVTFWKFKSNKDGHYKGYHPNSKLSPELKNLLPYYWRDRIYTEVWDKVISKVVMGKTDNLPEDLYVEGKRKNRGKIKCIPFKIQRSPLYRSNNLSFDWNNIAEFLDIISVEKFDLNKLENGKEWLPSKTVG